MVSPKTGAEPSLRVRTTDQLIHPHNYVFLLLVVHIGTGSPALPLVEKVPDSFATSSICLDHRQQCPGILHIRLPSESTPYVSRRFDSFSAFGFIFIFLFEDLYPE